MRKEKQKADADQGKSLPQGKGFELQLGIIRPNSGGIDIGSQSLLISYRSKDGAYILKEVLVFTTDLQMLGEELIREGVTDVSMEATGVYWMPVYEILTDKGLQVAVVNPRHYKNVDAEKTDVKDCQWLHQLHAHGLLRNSFIAPELHRELRSYIHERNNLQESKSRELNRIQRTLTLMNVKTQHLLSDIEGVNGIQIVRRIAEGITQPQKLLEGLNLKILKASVEDLERSLQGIYKSHYVTILKKHLECYDFYKKQMLDYETLIEELLKKMLPEQENHTPTIEKKKTKARKNQYHFNVKGYLHQITGVDLTAIDGIDEICALQVIAVTGTDMSKWKTADHFTSWLNLAPRPKISGGKLLGHDKRFTKNPATQALRVAAQTMWQNKGILGHLYRRLSATKGSKKAIKAVACRLAIIIYHMLKNKTVFDPRKVALDDSKIQAKKVDRLKKEAARLGFTLAKAA